MADSGEVTDKTSSKSLPVELRQKWIEELCAWADARWGPGWTQQQMADALKIKQGQWSDMKNKHEGIGVLQLMRASELTNRSINDMLGLDYPNVTEREMTLLVSKTEELMADLAKTFVHGGKRLDLITEIRRIAQASPFWRFRANPVVGIDKSVLLKEHHSRSKFPKGKAPPKSRAKVAKSA